MLNKNHRRLVCDARKTWNVLYYRILCRPIPPGRQYDALVHQELQSLPPPWFVREADISLGCELGAGVSGKVWRGTFRNSPVAVKFFASQDDGTASEVCSQLL